MPLDLSRTLDRVQERQWALADIDWDAPGADRITDEQRPKLAAFMADVAWIEQVGARAFAALARRAQDPTLAELYRSFHAEEQRHAHAEIALMRRRGMLDGDEPPEPPIRIRPALAWPARFPDSLPRPGLDPAPPRPAGAGPDAGRALPVLPRRGAAPRQRRDRPHAPVGDAGW